MEHCSTSKPISKTPRSKRCFTTIVSITTNSGTRGSPSKGFPATPCTWRVSGSLRVSARAPTLWKASPKSSTSESVPTKRSSASRTSSATACRAKQSTFLSSSSLSSPFSHSQDLQRGADTRSAWIDYSAFDAEATWHVRKELESLLREMFWTSEARDDALSELSMWDFYRRYYRDFGQLLVNMEQRGIHVTLAAIFHVGRRSAASPRN